MSKTLFFVLAGAVGAILAIQKGRNWLFWGAVCTFMPLSIIVLVLLPRVISYKDLKQCSFCAGLIMRDAVQCSHCGKQLPIEMVKCPGCEKFVPAGESCGDCGKRFNGLI